MTAMPAEKLTDPRQLYSVPRLDEEFAMEVASNLNPREWATFMKDVLDSVRQSHAEGDLRILNDTLEAWVRTFLFMGRPEFQDRWKEMQGSTEDPLTVEDLKARRHRKRPA